MAGNSVHECCDLAQKAKFDSCTYNQGVAEKSRNVVVVLY